MPTANLAMQSTASNPLISFAYLNPADTTGLLAWGDVRLPANFTASGGLVSQLLDLSGNGNTLNQSTSANKPAQVSSLLSGVSALSVAMRSSVGPFLAGATGSNVQFAINQPFSVSIIVGGTTEVASYPPMLTTTGGTSGTSPHWEIGMAYSGGLGYAAPFFALVAGSGASARVIASASAATSTSAVYLVTATYDGSGLAAGIKLYLNGTLLTTTTVADTLAGAAINAPVTNYLSLGSPLTTAGATSATTIPYYAHTINAGVLSVGDLATLHTYAQQQFGTA